MPKGPKPEPFLRIVPTSSRLIRAPRAEKRRMAVVLAIGLSFISLPMLLLKQPGAALFFWAIPATMFLSTFNGGRTVRLDERGWLEVRAAYPFWSRRIADIDPSDVTAIETQESVVEVFEESPLNALAALTAPFGVHVHFGGKSVPQSAWELVIELRHDAPLAAISTWERASCEAARDVLRVAVGSSQGKEAWDA